MFLTLTEPSRPMITEVAGAGLCEIAGFASVPRIQIGTIEQAMALRERAVEMPARRDDTFKKAPREEKRGAQGKMDLRAGRGRGVPRPTGWSRGEPRPTGRIGCSRGWTGRGEIGRASCRERVCYAV